MNDLQIKSLTESSVQLHLKIVECLRKSIRLREDGVAYKANDEVLKAEKLSEDAILYDRRLPLCLELSEAQDKVTANIREITHCELGYTENGWFCLRMPLLLPKKEHGNTWYIRSTLVPFFDSFFSKRAPHIFDDCIIIYRHIYDEKTPERRWRDHDNIEINMVTDVVGLYLMPDDGPLVCDHYYCSSKGKTEGTEVYLVPKYDFEEFLSYKKEGYLDDIVLRLEYPDS